jgi:hypothetical protein
MLRHPWCDIDAEYFVKVHARADAKHGHTCIYLLRDRPLLDERFTRAEAIAMHKSGAWPQEFGYAHGDAFYLNQHAAHSVQQFLHEAGLAWARHLQRMQRIRGTAAGRVPLPRA